MMALSADTQNEAAFAVANTDLKSFAESMYQEINKQIDASRTASGQAKEQLAAVYRVALVSNIVTICISVLSILAAVFIVQRRIIRPITTAEKELSVIISEIDGRNGDLTKRIPVYAKDELQLLGRVSIRLLVNCRESCGSFRTALERWRGLPGRFRTGLLHQITVSVICRP